MKLSIKAFGDSLADVQTDIPYMFLDNWVVQIPLVGYKNNFGWHR